MEDHHQAAVPGRPDVQLTQGLRPVGELQVVRGRQPLGQRAPSRTDQPKQRSGRYTLAKPTTNPSPLNTQPPLTPGPPPTNHPLDFPANPQHTTTRHRALPASGPRRSEHLPVHLVEAGLADAGITGPGCADGQLDVGGGCGAAGGERDREPCMMCGAQLTGRPPGRSAPARRVHGRQLPARGKSSASRLAETPGDGAVRACAWSGASRRYGRPGSGAPANRTAPAPAGAARSGTHSRHGPERPNGDGRSPRRTGRPR